MIGDLSAHLGCELTSGLLLHISLLDDLLKAHFNHVCGLANREITVTI